MELVQPPGAVGFEAVEVAPVSQIVRGTVQPPGREQPAVVFFGHITEVEAVTVSGIPFKGAGRRVATTDIHEQPVILEEDPRIGVDRILAVLFRDRRSEPLEIVIFQMDVPKRLECARVLRVILCLHTGRDNQIGCQHQPPQSFTITQHGPLLPCDFHGNGMDDAIALMTKVPALPFVSVRPGVGIKPVWQSLPKIRSNR